MISHSPPENLHRHVKNFRTCQFIPLRYIHSTTRIFNLEGANFRPLRGDFCLRSYVNCD